MGRLAGVTTLRLGRGSAHGQLDLPEPAPLGLDRDVVGGQLRLLQE